jgi:hypothetical protein
VSCISCCAEKETEFKIGLAPVSARYFFREQGFLPIGEKAYPLFRKYGAYSLLQEMGAPVIASWSFAYHGLYKVISGSLCAVYFHQDKPVYFTIHRPGAYPVAQGGLAELVDTLYGLARGAGLPFLQIKFIDEIYLKDYEGIPGYRIQTGRRASDDEYAYRIKDLLELSGTANFYKRKRLRRCASLPDMNLRLMTNENVGVCMDIEEEWCQGKDCVYCASFGGCEKKALAGMIDLFDDHVHQGLLLYLGDKPEGYIICEKMSGKLAFLYFGKSVREGFFVYLIYRMFRDYMGDVEYMNINEDMGSMGLRLFKSHLSIHELWPKYICTYTKAEDLGGRVWRPDSVE